MGRASWLLTMIAPLLLSCTPTPPPQIAMSSALHAAVSGHATAALRCAAPGFRLRGPGQPSRSASATSAWLASRVFPTTGHAVANVSRWGWSHRGAVWTGRATMGFAAMGGPFGPRLAQVRITGVWVKEGQRWRCRDATWAWSRHRPPGY